MQLFCTDKLHQGFNPLSHEHFHKNSRRKTGYQGYCKICHHRRYGKKAIERTKQYVIDNPTYRNDYYQANVESLSHKRKDRYQNTSYGEAAREYGRKYYKANAEILRILAREYNNEHKEIKLEYGKSWRRNNKDKVNEYQMYKYAKKLNATPPWYKNEVEEIQNIYKMAVELTKTTGIKYEVDHIIPLISDVVCGLHCKDNLRVITKKENTSKRNKLLST